MSRIGALVLTILAAGFMATGGCGDNNSAPVNIVGTWTGSMTHRVIDSNNGTDVTGTYDIAFFITSEQGSAVSGKMELVDASHVGLLSGTMDGNHFSGERIGSHTVQIEFTVNGNTLTGTFRFTGDGLDEWGNFTCTRQ